MVYQEGTKCLLWPAAGHGRSFDIYARQRRLQLLQVSAVRSINEVMPYLIRRAQEEQRYYEWCNKGTGYVVG